ncbi:MarR family transcriptional regulator [Paenibacillus sp. PR3]|uniref:MarR family transcriptional regulator n=2 Tax=Paenibacillus terricola TaxID=2763503 RepID=A0ABR8N195_9BACL|nr:MarR family transcriptional regulator [Paenibacillus terricola]
MVSKEALFEQLASLIASAHQLHYEMTKDLPMDDITPLQYEILEFLSVKQPITLSQLSECKGISMPNTSREIKKLTDKGLCEKIDDAGDRRKQYVRLSASGEARMAESFTHMKQLFLQRVEGVQDAELTQMSEAIGVLRATVLRD